MLLLYIFVLVMIFSSVPLLVSMTKKASEGATMRRAIEQAGGKFIPSNIFWYIGRIDSKNCDFHVVFDGRLISVKVISFFSSNTMVNFIDKYAYEIKTPKTSSDAEKKNYQKKKKKPYNFKKGIPEEFSKLPAARIILINTPYPLKVTRTLNSEMKNIGVSDDTGEGELYTPTTFIKLFK